MYILIVRVSNFGSFVASYDKADDRMILMQAILNIFLAQANSKIRSQAHFALYYFTFLFALCFLST